MLSSLVFPSSFRGLHFNLESAVTLFDKKHPVMIEYCHYFDE